MVSQNSRVGLQKVRNRKSEVALSAVRDGWPEVESRTSESQESEVGSRGFVCRGWLARAPEVGSRTAESRASKVGSRDLVARGGEPKVGR